MMVPNGWYPGFTNAASQKMVQEYVAQYGGTASGVNADVAEAYSVGQVTQQAITAVGGVDNAKIISYLHSGVTLQTVQGTVKFDSLGENTTAIAFVFQWQKTRHAVRPGPAGRRVRLGGDPRDQAGLDQLSQQLPEPRPVPTATPDGKGHRARDADPVLRA